VVVDYDPRIHHRRSIRLARYDYSQGGAYFITICTRDRELSLKAEPVREAIRSTWCGLPTRFPGVELDEFVIMPNHIHGIIVMRESGAGSDLGAVSGAPTLGRIIRAFKSISAIEANRALGRSNRPFWQRNYYDHVIRDEEELNAIRQYIRGNPGNWPDDPENPTNI